MSAEYVVRAEVPSVSTYRHLRSISGMSPKSEAAAVAGLAGSLFAVQVFLGEQAVGMGRLIGDGGCHYQIVDIAVHPDHQGQGLGKRIMAALMEHVEATVPESAYISLIADGKAHHLYSQFGFKPTAPASIGMSRYF